MRKKLPVLGLLLVLALLVLACQAPAAQVDTELSNVEATIEQSPAEAPTATTAAIEAAAPTAAPTEANQDDTSTSSDSAADEPDPLSVDPDRPGFTLDGSPTLGAADAPILIIDFSDFQ